jgi:hypothetical protein
MSSKKHNENGGKHLVLSSSLFCAWLPQRQSAQAKDDVAVLAIALIWRLGRKHGACDLPSKGRVKR